MFDRLVAEAKAVGGGDLLEGLKYMDENLDEFDSEIRSQFRVFMNMGAKMFAPL